MDKVIEELDWALETIRNIPNEIEEKDDRSIDQSGRYLILSSRKGKILVILQDFYGKKLQPRQKYNQSHFLGLHVETSGDVSCESHRRLWLGRVPPP